MRTDTLRNAYDEILETESLEEYQTKAEEYVLKLEKEGFIETKRQKTAVIIWCVRIL